MIRNALKSGLELTFKSLYKDLLKDPDFKRWFDNIKRGSVSYAYESLRKIGQDCPEMTMMARGARSDSCRLSVSRGI